MTVTYQVVLADQLPGGLTQISNTASVTSVQQTSPAQATVTNPILLPDLTAAKTNNVSGNLVLGNSYTWTVQVSNATGAGRATFTTGQTILTDNLPAGPAYGAVTVTNGTTPPGGTGNVSCAIVAGTLTCTASGGTVSLPEGASFSAAFGVTPVSAGSLVNPAIGGGNKCQVDPDNVLTESNEGNNDCTDSVTVFAPTATPSD